LQAESSRHDHGCAELFVHIAKNLFFLSLLAVVAPAGGAHAEPMYVIEQLVVGVNSAPAGEADRVATIKSGDRVELLDRQGDEVQIQLPNGATGWVKASYLSAQEPLQKRLQDSTAEAEKLKQDLRRLQSQLAARVAAGTRAAAVSSPSPPASSVPTAGPTSAGIAAPAPLGPVRDASPLMTRQEQPGEAPWVWTLGSSAAALLVGFVAGWRMLDRRIRRKYGGLRIY
jgi:hypothetical protein